MARLHLSAGETKELAGASDTPVIILNWLVDTDGTNDATLKIVDRGGPVLASGGFTVTGTDNGGGAVLQKRCTPPSEASLSGTGSTACIEYLRE